MVDDEAQRIREEVIQALEKQQMNGLIADSGLDADEPCAQGCSKGSQFVEAGGVPRELEKADEFAEASEESLRIERIDDEAGEVDEAEAERAFLSAVFDDVRTQSATSALVEPSRWPLMDLVPPHQTPDEWEMFVYEYVEERAKTNAAEESRTSVRSATRAVGVPQRLRADVGANEDAPNSADETDEDASHSACDAPSLDPSAAAGDAPSPDPAAVVDISSLDPSAAAEASSPDPVCDDIVALVGKRSYYLYSNEHMTDAYARWSFLAAEDDRVLTFVECVREESRTYPRPMGASALTNEPFNFQPAEVAELWETIRESGAYPDIDTVTASNGDVYYFSTEYLSPAYAASLAEWNSVERDMFL